MKPEAVDLNQIVRGLEDLLRATIGEHVQIELAANGTIAPVLSDPGELEQVIMNLASVSR